jgi:hypothetical protein
MVEANANVIVFPGSYQNYQNGAVNNKLTDVGRGEGVLGVTVNLLM